MCRTAAPVVVGASLDETVRVHCAVDADPRDVRFTWRLTNSVDTFEVSPQRTGSLNATTNELRYQPESDKDYGTLTCWGRNSVGGQSDPCVFRVIPASKLSLLAAHMTALVQYRFFKVHCLTRSFSVLRRS